MEPKLFKQEYNDRVEELKNYIALNINSDFRTLGPKLAMAEKKYITPVLGNEIFNALVEYYNGEFELEEDSERTWRQMLEYTQNAVAKLAYWEGYDEMSVVMDDRGARAGAEEGRLYRYQEENLKRSLCKQGYDCIDMILETVEENPSVFEKYGKTPWKKDVEELVFQTTKDFQKYFDIKNSRLVFIRMLYSIRTVQNTSLCHSIGRETVEEFVKHINQEKYARIEYALKSYVANKSVAVGISELKKMPTEKGLIYETSQQDGYNENQVGRNDTADTIELYEKRAEAFLTQLIYILNKNITDYPEYRQYTTGRNPVRQKFHRDNHGKKTFWL